MLVAPAFRVYKAPKLAAAVPLRKLVDGSPWLESRPRQEISDSSLVAFACRSGELDGGRPELLSLVLLLFWGVRLVPLNLVYQIE